MDGLFTKKLFILPNQPSILQCGEYEFFAHLIFYIGPDFFAIFNAHTNFGGFIGNVLPFLCTSQNNTMLIYVMCVKFHEIFGKLHIVQNHFSSSS